MWKRNKEVLYLGSVHGGDIPEMYGITDNHLGVDAVSTSFIHFIRSRRLTRVIPVNFINHRDPNYPKGSTAASLLSNITWPKYTLDTKQMFLFSDNATEAYTTIPDTYRADGIAAIIELQLALGQ